MVNFITHNSASNFQHVEYNVCGKKIPFQYIFNQKKKRSKILKNIHKKNWEKQCITHIFQN